MIEFWRKFSRDDDGSAIVEYALVLSLVSVVSWGALLAIGDALSNYFVDSSAGLGKVATDPK